MHLFIVPTQYDIAITKHSSIQWNYNIELYHSWNAQIFYKLNNVFFTHIHYTQHLFFYFAFDFLHDVVILMDSCVLTNKLNSLLMKDNLFEDDKISLEIKKVCTVKTLLCRLFCSLFFPLSLLRIGIIRLFSYILFFLPLINFYACLS